MTVKHMARRSDDREEEESLAQLVTDWLGSLHAFEVRALTIVGPSTSPQSQQREVWTTYPSPFVPAAETFARSDAYGATWRASNSPTMAWQNLSDGSAWSRSLMEHNVLSIVRCDVAMPFNAGFECVAMVGKQITRGDAFEIGWALSNCWPTLKDAVIASRFGLTPRVREVLRVLAEGYTAKETAEIVGCKERTVGFHLTTAMQKLGAENRAAAILRACMLGVL